MNVIIFIKKRTLAGESTIVVEFEVREERREIRSHYAARFSGTERSWKYEAGAAVVAVKGEKVTAAENTNQPQRENEQRELLLLLIIFYDDVETRDPKSNHLFVFLISLHSTFFFNSLRRRCKCTLFAMVNV